ncbi:hypothetical protein MKW94_003157, partial [Papaver nudicaule]|nr:hypothetical protein [Papaver nudicaule]
MPSLSSVCAFQVLLLVFSTVLCSTTTALDADVVLATRKLQAASTLGSNSTSNDRVTKQGCRDKCGNVSIPYPFGMGSGNCYLDQRFKITCNDSSSSPVAYLKKMHRQYEVLQITPDYVRISVLAPVICDIDNFTSATSKLIDPLTSSSEPDLEGTIFTVSDTRNKLTVLGCNIYGYITTQIFQFGDQISSPSSGCASRCSTGPVALPFSCVGSGCCKVSIPKGLTKFSIQTNRISFGSESTFAIGNYASYGPCNRVTRSRVFLVDQEFSGVLDLLLSKSDLFVTLILDWAISDVTEVYDRRNRVRVLTCAVAQRYPSSYACGHNSYCLESESGYRCKCLTGYQGNPYLLLGCQ